MWIEGDNNRGSIFGMGMPRGSGDDGLVTEMHAIEGADGEEERTLQLREIGGGMNDFHHACGIREASGTGGAGSCEPRTWNWRRRAPPSNTSKS